MRARMRSPTAISVSMSACGPRAWCTGSSTVGRSPSAPSQTSGMAMRSPSSSRPVTSNTATGGRLPVLRRPLRLPDSVPSPVRFASSRLRSRRCGTLDAERARDLALADLARRVADEVEDFGTVGELPPLGARPFVSVGFARTSSACLDHGNCFKKCVSCRPLRRQPPPWPCRPAALQPSRAWLRACRPLRLASHRWPRPACSSPPSLCAPASSDGPLAARAARSSTASSTVIAAGSLPLGIVALTLSCFT